MPDQDELAVKEARGFFDAAAKEIREKAMVPELPVEMKMEVRSNDLVAVFSGVVVGRS